MQDNPRELGSPIIPEVGVKVPIVGVEFQATLLSNKEKIMLCYKREGGELVLESFVDPMEAANAFINAFLGGS